MSKRKKSRGTFLFGLIVAALAVVGWGAGPGGWFRPEEVQALDGVPVRRGDLRISEIARGDLEAKDSVRLTNDIEGRATIIFLIEEGTHVEVGDLVCELDVSEQRDRRITQEIAVKKAEAGFTKATEELEIQKIQNESDIAKAGLDKELADLELEKYEAKEGEWTHELASADEAIKIAEEELKQAEDTANWTQQLFDKGFAQRTELERDQLTVEKSNIKLVQARRQKALKEAFENRKTLAELRAAVATAERDVVKAEKQATARLADFEAAKESAEFELARERDKLTKLVDQLGKARIVAPEAGMVVYARRRSGRMGGAEIPEEGGEVHERQEIVTIPRPGGMVANVSLHETKLENVRVGLPVRVTVDAVPGQVFQGKVAFVAAVADSGSWMSNPNQRLYKTEVTLDNTAPEMRPGMSCQIEILVDELEDVLYIPRQAVFLDGDNTVCFLRTDSGSVETREVEVGQDNTSWAEIRAGLEESDIVLLSPPASWEPSPAAKVAPTSEFGEALPAGEGGGASPMGAAPMARGGGERGGGERGDRSGGERRGGGGGFPNMSDEERAAMIERYQNMSEEEKVAARAEMQKRFGSSGGEGRQPMGGRRGDQDDGQ